MINTWNNIKDSFWNIVTGIVNSAENAWTNLKMVFQMLLIG